MSTVQQLQSSHEQSMDSFPCHGIPRRSRRGGRKEVRGAGAEAVCSRVVEKEEKKEAVRRRNRKRKDQGEWAQVPEKKSAEKKRLSSAVRILSSGAKLVDEAEKLLAVLPMSTRGSIRTRYLTLATDGSFQFGRAGYGAVSDDHSVKISTFVDSVSIGSIDRLHSATRYETLAILAALRKAAEEPTNRDRGVVILTDALNLIHALKVLGGTKDPVSLKYGAPVADYLKKEIEELLEAASNFSLGVWVSHIPRGVVDLHEQADAYSRREKPTSTKVGSSSGATVFLKARQRNTEEAAPRTVPSRLPAEEGRPSVRGYLVAPVEQFIHAQLLQGTGIDLRHFFRCTSRYMSFSPSHSPSSRSPSPTSP